MVEKKGKWLLTGLISACVAGVSVATTIVALVKGTSSDTEVESSTDAVTDANEMTH